EAVTNFVTDDRADRTEVLCGIRFGVIKRRAQNCSGESNVINYWIVESVHRLRGAKPLITVSRLANLVELKIMSPGIAVAQVCNQVCTCGGKFQARVIAPVIWVANLGFKLAELFQSTLARFRPHPFQLRDALALSATQLSHQLSPLCLGRCREVPLDEHLADFLTHQALRQAQRPLPPVTLLRRTGELAAVELKLPPAYFLP